VLSLIGLKAGSYTVRTVLMTGEMVMQILLEKARPLALVAAVAVGIFAYPNSSIAEARYSAYAGVLFVLEFVRPEGADYSFVEYSVSSQITSSCAEFSGTGTATIDLNEGVRW
jgi:hypothetical protein